jgi:hypothetical protein
MKLLLFGIVAVLMCTAISAGEHASQIESWTSKRGLFIVSYQSELEPLQINQLHSWLLHLENPNGVPINDAKIEVDGGMPEHDHGLATRPRVTAAPGEGDYQLDGLRFHMHGDWELLLTIVADGKTDTVVVNVTL